MNFDADDEFSSVRIFTLQVNYENTDYLSSYTATRPRQTSSGLMTNVHDSMQVFFEFKTLLALFTEKETLAQFLINLSRNNKMIQKTNPSI